MQTINYRDLGLFLSLSFIVLMFTACNQKHFVPSHEGEKLMPRRVATATDQQRVALQTELRNHSVTVISIGEQYLVSIPAKCLFFDQSPRLTWTSYRVLNKVVDYLKQFRKVSVHVTGYAAQYVSRQREHALTLKRARMVSKYLFSQGIDARFVFSEGAGSNKPIVAYPGGGDASPDARIEITFEDMIE